MLMRNDGLQNIRGSDMGVQFMSLYCKVMSKLSSIFFFLICLVSIH